MPYSANDFCILNGRLFFHTPGGEKVLQEVTWAGDTLREFGPSLEFEQGGEDLSHLLHRPIGAALRKKRNEGRLLCMDQPELLVLVAEQMGWARAFTPSGTQVWNVDLPDFHPLHFANPGGTAIAFIPDPESGTIHGLVSLSQIDSLTFSASFRESGLLDQEGALEVRFLSLQSGEQLDLVKGAEFGACGVTEQGVLVGVSNYPFLRVGIFERSPRK